MRRPGHSLVSIQLVGQFFSLAIPSFICGMASLVPWISSKKQAVKITAVKNGSSLPETFSIKHIPTVVLPPKALQEKQAANQPTNQPSPRHTKVFVS